jgi:hypothetical protein
MVAGTAMPLTQHELFENALEERKAFQWRFGVFVALGAIDYLLLRSLDSVRLLTISQAPSYIPAWVGFYYETLGGVLAATLLVGASCLVHMRRWTLAKNRFLASLNIASQGGDTRARAPTSSGPFGSR